MAFFIILFLAITGICIFTPSFAQQVEQKITITTDKSLYSLDDTVKISGRVSELEFGSQVTLRIKAPNGNLVAAKQLDVNPDKTFSLTINAREYAWKLDGTYTFIAQYGSNSEAQTTFAFYDDTSPATSKSDGVPTNDETFIGFQNFVMSNFKNASFLMVLFFAGVIIGLSIYFIIKRLKRCKHDWQITYQNKQNSFFCTKCGKRASGTRTYRRRNRKQIGIILGGISVFIIGFVIFYPHALPTYITIPNFSQLQIPKLDELSNITAPILKAVKSSIEFTEQFIIGNNLIVIFSVIVIVAGIGIVYFVKLKKKSGETSPNLTPPTPEPTPSRTSPPPVPPQITKTNVHSDGNNSTSYVPFTQEELKELRSKQEEERKREERETKEVSKKYNDSESEEIHRKQKEEKQKREEKKPREQKPKSVFKGEDPYKILGVKQNVACTELKSKFRELAKKHSPDHGIVNMTEQEKEQKTRMFIKIKKAYDELRESKNCKD